MGFGKKVDILPSCFGLNPTGLQYSTDNQFVQRLKELQESAAVEKIPLIPSTPEEMSEMLQLCSYVRFRVPQQVTWSQQQCACPLSRAQVASTCFLLAFLPCTHLFIHSTSICIMPMMYPALCLSTVGSK